MGYAPLHHGLVIVVGDGRSDIADGGEGELRHVVIVDNGLNLGGAALLAGEQVFDDGHLVVEMVDPDDEAIENIVDVGDRGELIARLGDINFVEVSDGVVGGVAEEAVARGWVAVKAESVDVGAQGVGDVGVLRHFDIYDGAIGVGGSDDVVAEHERADRVDAHERHGVLLRVVVGAFEERRLRIEVTQFEIDAHRRLQVGRYGGSLCYYLHIWL